jgi:hypothetical protein
MCFSRFLAANQQRIHPCIRALDTVHRSAEQSWIDHPNITHFRRRRVCARQQVGQLRPGILRRDTRIDTEYRLVVQAMGAERQDAGLCDFDQKSRMGNETRGDREEHQ